MKNIFIFILLSFSNANAIIEVRGHFGLDFTSPNSFNAYLSGEKIQQLYMLPLYGGDALVTIPFFVIGGRYQQSEIILGRNDMNLWLANYQLAKVNEGRQAIAHINFMHISGLAGFRIPIGKDAYFGPIGTYGVRNYKSLIHVRSGENDNRYYQGKLYSHSEGLEFGFRYFPIILAVEFGHKWLNLTDMKTVDDIEAPYEFKSGGFFFLFHLGFSL